jgi:hypothetical protein|tara:strand:- start:224 stop:508 length:285 start_codon:yes stop_codon:yes gene_type:complete
MMTFTCGRCGEKSEGRQYHAACFDNMYKEEQIIKQALAQQAKAKVDSERRKSQSLILQSKKRLAIDRGLSQRSHNELEDAEIMWSQAMDGRSFR